MYTKLFERIIDGRYPPEARLREETLAKEFKVSRTPVREVLRQLEKDGLIRIVPNRGAIVIPFTPDDVEDIYEIRKALELLAFDFSFPSLSIQRLTEIRSMIIENSKTKDYGRHSEMDALLHNYIIKSCGKRYLISMLDQLLRLIQRFREFGFKDGSVREQAVKEHIEFIDAICLRDMVKAKNLLSAHISGSKARALAYLLNKKHFNT